MSTRAFASLIMPVLLAAGCGQKVGPLSEGAAFVALPITANGAQSFAQGKVSSDGTEFYLAINRNQLGNRFFFTATIANWLEYQNPEGGPNPLWSYPADLLSAIVTFEIHDGKLYVIDASKQWHWTNALNPEVVLDAYPIVTDSSFNDMDNHDHYVLINPAAGDQLRYIDQNGLLGGSHVCNNCNDAPRITLSFAQNFRATSDASGANSAVMFDQVVSGVIDATDLGTNVTQQSDMKFSGTLGITIRPYSDGPGFVPTFLEALNFPARDYFFHFTIIPVVNQFDFNYPVLKLNIHPGMTPIEWVISDEVYNDPRIGSYDIVGALKNGIEDWNGVFGYPVFHATVGPIADALRDDTKSVLVWDNNPGAPAGFMTGAPNPDTGEERRGFIYLPSSFIPPAEIIAFQDGLQEPASAAPPAPAVPSAAPRFLAWGNQPSLVRCVLPAAAAAKELGQLRASSTALDPSIPSTKKEFVEYYLRAAVNHETGHNLGLRHNFEGSLSQGAEPDGNHPAGVSSSTMDYLRGNDRVRLAFTANHLGTYDFAAVNFLYSNGPEPASFAFCNDGDLFNGADPNCNQNDSSGDPLHDYYGNFYNVLIQAYGCPSSAVCMSFFVAPSFERFTNGVLQYVRADPDLGRRQDAWNVAFSPARVPGQDALAAKIINRVVLDTPDQRGDWTADPAPDILVASIIPDFQATLVDSGSNYSFATRRAAVDALEHVQLTEALDALLAARNAIAAARASLTGDQAALTDDLLARIDAATHPYFK
jgi:hypothetical protein